MRSKHLILIGFPQCGKTTYGKFLGKMFAIPFLDTDTLLEERAQKSCRILFKEHGETYFRQKEGEILKDLDHLKPHIIATGGGTPIFHGETLKNLGKILYLEEEMEILKIRLFSKETPPYLEKTRFLEWFEKREKIYNSLADIKIKRLHAVQ